MEPRHSSPLRITARLPKLPSFTARPGSVALNELVNGIFRDETRAELLAIVDRMKGKIDPPSPGSGAAGIDGVILAGTELPLILRQPAHNGIPFLNTTIIHCRAAVAEMLK